MKYGQEDGQLEIRDVPEPKLESGQVLLEVKAAGICGWDIEMWRHTMANPVQVPVIQGHEFAGQIAEVAPEVNQWKPGQRVVSETSARICGICPMCRTGNYNLCPDRKGFGYGIDGAFTKYVAVPTRCLHEIPENVTFTQAAVTEPACVAYHALIKYSSIQPGNPILIIGPGPVGIFSAMVAKAAGANPVIVAGTQKSHTRLDIALSAGADHIINVNKEDPLERIAAFTGRPDVPLVIDAAGNENALRLAIDAVAKLGQITKLGWGPKPVNLSLDPLINKTARLQGTFSHTYDTWRSVISMIANRQIEPEKVITHKFRLDQWLEAFHAVENRDALKAVFVFES